MNNDIIRPLIFWAQQKRWLLFTFLLGVIMYWLPYPETISISGYRTIILAIMVIILIIAEPIPLPATALLIAVLEVSFHIAPAAEVAQSYMNDSVFFIMGSLMMAVAIVHQGLDTRLALGIIKLTGNKVSNIVFGFALISALLLRKILTMRMLPDATAVWSGVCPHSAWVLTWALADSNSSAALKLFWSIAKCSGV